MSEPVYERTHPDQLPHPFTYVFEIRDDWWVFLRLQLKIRGEVIPFVEHPEIKAVVEWATERFGEGSLPRPSTPALSMAMHRPERDAVSCAWSMDGLGTVAFQHEDHALEFRLRWC